MQNNDKALTTSLSRVGTRGLWALALSGLVAATAVQTAQAETAPAQEPTMQALLTKAKLSSNERSKFYEALRKEMAGAAQDGARIKILDPSNPQDQPHLAAAIRARHIAIAAAGQKSPPKYHEIAATFRLKGTNEMVVIGLPAHLDYVRYDAMINHERGVQAIKFAPQFSAFLSSHAPAQTTVALHEAGHAVGASVGNRYDGETAILADKREESTADLFRFMKQMQANVPDITTKIEAFIQFRRLELVTTVEHPDHGHDTTAALRYLQKNSSRVGEIVRDMTAGDLRAKAEDMAMNGLNNSYDGFYSQNVYAAPPPGAEEIKAAEERAQAIDTQNAAAARYVSGMLLKPRQNKIPETMTQRTADQIVVLARTAERYLALPKGHGLQQGMRVLDKKFPELMQKAYAQANQEDLAHPPLPVAKTLQHAKVFQAGAPATVTKYGGPI